MVQSLNRSLLEKVPWSREGCYLNERPSFTLDPLFHAGAYYVQEASSMFLEQALEQSVDLFADLKVLDLCAAPGGKSTLIQSLLSAESLLISNEVIKSRVNVLSENITKWGAANVVVTNNDPRDFKRLGRYFDVIIVDAPCSGSGLFRKDPEAIREWSENNVELCGQRQQRILTDVLPCLKEEGVLIYSTCSYSPAEDEEILDWLIDSFPLETLSLKLPEEWKIVESQSPVNKAAGYRFFPDKLRGEGFFITVLRDKGTAAAQKRRGTDQVPARISAAELSVVAGYVRDPRELFFFKQHEAILAMPLACASEINLLRESLYIKKAGIRTGVVIRKEMVPDHELAMSIVLQDDLPSIELDQANALRYLRRETINIDHQARGWALIRYGSLPLGWIKILANRINNYYPQNWRILNK